MGDAVLAWLRTAGGERGAAQEIGDLDPYEFMAVTLTFCWVDVVQLSGPGRISGRRRGSFQ
jgi:hypothetical protein